MKSFTFAIFAFILASGGQYMTVEPDGNPHRASRAPRKLGDSRQVIKLQYSLQTRVVWCMWARKIRNSEFVGKGIDFAAFQAINESVYDYDSGTKVTPCQGYLLSFVVKLFALSHL